MVLLFTGGYSIRTSQPMIFRNSQHIVIRDNILSDFYIGEWYDSVDVLIPLTLLRLARMCLRVAICLVFVEPCHGFKPCRVFWLLVQLDFRNAGIYRFASINDASGIKCL